MTEKDLSSELLSTLQDYYSLGIKEQIDWEKFYLYSIITHSTAIEGSTVTEVEAQLLFDEGITSSKRTMVEQMMNLDLKNAYEYGIKWIKQHPEITVDSLVVLSSKVMAHTGSEYHTIAGDFSTAKGELRKVNVTAGFGGTSYMAYQKIPAELEAFCQNLNELRKKLNPKDIVSVYRLSFWAHYELVTIHPWADGNGRMSRLLMNLLQWEFGLIPSKVLKEDKAEYIQALIDSREKDDDGIFINFMLNLHARHLQREIEQFNVSMSESNEKMVDKSSLKQELVDKWSIKPTLAEKLVDILHFMSDKSQITTEELVQHFNFTPTTSKRYLRQLSEFGYLEALGGNKNRSYKLKEVDL
ncbi:MAG: Fic family protein [Treponema sp.]|nr:Fic family protein [Treponema sp.]